MKFYIWFVVMVAMFFCMGTSSYAGEDSVPDIGADPLETTPQSILGPFRLQYRPVSQRMLGTGNASLGLNFTHSNYWVIGGFPPDYYLGVLFDAEITEALYSLDYGVLDEWDIGIRVRVMSVHGGFLDGYIEWFHGFFNFPNASRERFKRNKVFFYDSRYGAAPFSEGTFLNDVIIENKVAVGNLFKIIHQLRIPVDSPMGGVGMLVAAQLDGRWRDFGLTMAFGVAWHEDRDFFFYETNPVVEFGFVGLSARLEPDFSLAMGFHVASNTVGNYTIKGDEVWHLDHLAIEIHAGFRWMVTPSCVIQFAVIENFTVVTAADISFNFSIKVFGPK